MQLVLITNPDDTQSVAYKLARIVFAETLGASLPVVEAMASLIYNIHLKHEKSFNDIAKDKNIFGVPGVFNYSLRDSGSPASLPLTPALSRLLRQPKQYG